MDTDPISKILNDLFKSLSTFFMDFIRQILAAFLF